MRAKLLILLSFCSLIGCGQPISQVAINAIVPTKVVDSLSDSFKRLKDDALRQVDEDFLALQQSLLNGRLWQWSFEQSSSLYLGTRYVYSR